MNSTPDAVRILCYGDSNTWGYIPGVGDRFPLNKRWTGLLQKTLGSGYEVIEEGLNARTTTIDDQKYEGRNGATYLIPCMHTHSPIDIVILMLGTNDLKERFGRSPEQIAEGIDTLLSIITHPESNYNHKANVILMSPPIVDESVEGVESNYLGAESKSKQLGSLYEATAKRHQISFIDLSQFVRPSKNDGYHLDADAHAQIAELLAKKIRSM